MINQFKLFLFLLVFSLILLYIYNKSNLNETENLDSLISIINPEFKSNLQIKLRPSGLCEFKSKFVLIYIFTSVNSFTKRQKIRDTWAIKSLPNNLNFNLVFIIGDQRDEKINKQIKQEQYKYNDLIQGNFIDAYRNLSYKSLITWRWINKKCSHASYVIKLDDDVLLNTFKLNQFISKSNYNLFETNKNSFICWILRASYPLRNSDSKWFASEAEYNHNLYKNITSPNSPYPFYCNGPGVIMTTDLISKLYRKAFEIKLFWIDDVYVGILGHYVKADFKDITYLYSGDFNRLKDIIFVLNANSIDDIQRIWNYLIKSAII